MGKSPAKWIKTVLFGKKSVRSHASKGRYDSKAANDNVGKGSPTLAVNFPLISEPILVSTDNNGITPALEKGAPSNLGEAVTFPTSQYAETQGSVGAGASSDPEKYREERAAIKAQAAFRGFLARRAFHALRGIIRLQALVRGHLVRRQAVATLRAIQGIVKLQALARGQRVRRSGIGLEINTKFGQRKTVDAKISNAWKEKFAVNAFICKLLSSSPVAMPLQVQYDDGEPNSVYNWLERWTSSRSWKPLSKRKKALDSKSQTKRGSYAMETESSRPKRSVRRNSTGNDAGSTNVVSEPEKSKRNLRNIPSSPADSVLEHPQNELEKVKRNLRKVSNVMTEASIRPEAEVVKPNRSLRMVSNTPSDVPDQVIDEYAENANKYIASTPEVVKPGLESASKSAEAEGVVGALLDDIPPVELQSHPLQSIEKEENLSVLNGELSSKEEQTCHENQKSSKRRASFSAKPEYAENGLQNTPPLPSYMAATKSAKAKLREQCSPKIGSDSADRNGITRRHSLPSSTNGKLTSHSPRTQRPVQASDKGGVRSDRPLLSSRDGNERPIQVEWRR